MTCYVHIAALNTLAHYITISTGFTDQMYMYTLPRTFLCVGYQLRGRSGVWRTSLFVGRGPLTQVTSGNLALIS